MRSELEWQALAQSQQLRLLAVAGAISEGESFGADDEASIQNSQRSCETTNVPAEGVARKPHSFHSPIAYLDLAKCNLNRHSEMVPWPRTG